MQRFDALHERLLNEAFSPEEAAEKMIARYGSVKKALEWAELHRAESADPEYWERVKNALKTDLRSGRL